MTTTSKAPSLDTVLDLLTDTLSRDINEGWSRGLGNTRGEPPAPNGGVGPDPDGPYGHLYHDPALAIREDAFAQRIADEVGVTKATGFKYLRALMDRPGSPLVSIDVHVNDGSIGRVANAHLHDAVLTPEGHRLSMSTSPKITSRGYAQPPDVKGERHDNGWGGSHKTDKWVARYDDVVEHVQREQAWHDRKARAAAERERALHAEVDALHPGLREALRNVTRDPDREGFFRQGSYVNFMRDGDTIRMTLAVSSDDSLALLAKALGL